MRSKMDDQEIILPKDESDMKTKLISLIQEPASQLAEFVTGVLVSDTAVWKLSVGKIVQATVRGRLLQQLGTEIQKYKETGRIEEDYLASNRSTATFSELLEFIDEETPDKEVFDALKSIFLKSIEVGADEAVKVRAQQLLKIAKQLESMDVLVLRAVYTVYSKPLPEYHNINTTGEWMGIVSKLVGYDLPELVSQSNEKLEKMSLLSERTYGDKSGVRSGREFRLTSLGIKLCEHIVAFDEPE